MKIFFRRIHLYLGLVTGLILMITCFTGAVLVYEKELLQFVHQQRYFTTKQNNRLTLDELIKSVRLKEPSAKINSVKIYTDARRTAEISITMPLLHKTANTVSTNLKENKKPAEGSRLTAFVDPYSGRIIEIYNHRNSFFYFIMDLHRWMLGGDIGKLIVGIATLIFLIILITGIILWWPKNKQILKQRLKLKSNAGFKRLNHDYHIVLGFYSAIFLFIFAFTGLAWSFEWFNKGIYTITGTSMERPKAPKSQKKEPFQPITVEAALNTIQNKVADDALYYSIGLPKDSTDAFSVILLTKEAKHESAGDTYFIDAYKDSILSSQLYKNKNSGQKIRATFKPIHVASIYGNTSKIIGIIVCLLGTFFPISGLIMWLNRTRKKKINFSKI